MDESKTNRSSVDGLGQTGKHHKHNKETHGLSDDIEANTPVGDVKGPNVFERVKEEFEAIKEAIHHKDDKNQDSPSNVNRDDATITRSKHEKHSSLSGKTGKHHMHNKETHGLSDDIDANTPVGDVKGPNVFVRVKEEFEAIKEAIHHKDDKNQDSPSNVVRDDATVTRSKHEKQSSLSEEHKSPVHHKETHGRGDDIDADIPISEFKGPSIFHRAKEEIEALVETIHSKKESDHDEASPKKEGGFRASVSKKLHKIRNRD